MDIRQQLERFMEARSIALVGVPRRTGDGHNLLENILDDGYTGELYPVNPYADEILGRKVYHSAAELPEGIDLAVIFTGRSQVPQAARECVAKGIKALVVVAQGMADVGGEGVALQEELRRVAMEGGARVLGPNSFGVANAFTNLNTAFVHFDLETVPIASIAQSGLLFGGTARRLLLGKGIDLGNTCDLDFADGLEYFADDPQVKVIVLYMERVMDGPKLMKVAQRVSREKPVIAIKGGRTLVGARLAQSHTGAIAGQAEIYAAAFKQCGIIQATDFDELDDLVLSFCYLPLPKGRRVAIMTFTMGAGILATDACINNGLELAELAPETKERISHVFPSWLSVRNPVDIGPSGFVEPDRHKMFVECVEGLLQDPGVDAVLLILPARTKRMDQFKYGFHHLAQRLAGENPTKPLTVWIYNADEGEVASIQYMKAQNVVAYPTVERAARALSRLASYAQWRKDGRVGALGG